MPIRWPAGRGFVALAFEPSFIGESGGPHNIASGDIHTEDIMSAVDRLGQESLVDRNRIGAIGILRLGIFVYQCHLTRHKN